MALRGLLIRQPYVDWIVDGKKTWEVRGSATKVRGPIALIQSRSGTVVGTCDLVDVHGPLSLKELHANATKLNSTPRDIGGTRPYGDHTYAWVLRNAKRLPKPVAYEHPSGAVIWVTLSATVARKIGKTA